MAETFYITTPIYYVNGLPHIGHAYTTIAADTVTRWHRMLGHDAFFLTGTDEHGTKVLDAAKARGLTPQAHCDDLVVGWKAMWERLGITYSRFLRTTDLDHEACVRAVLVKLHAEGLIYKAEYTGWYSVSEEIFVTEKDISEGKYDRANLQQITESNWFFAMSRYQQALIDHIEANPTFLQPESRKNEVKGFLRKELGDLCISRPKVRMSWGIEIPFDADYVTYVWFDALLNYLSGVGYHPDAEKADPNWMKWWPVDFHLVGKDILTTHAVYWSTMLLALGVPLPKTLYAHGWWVDASGEKQSKSKGNAIDIGLLADAFGVDATRYFFLREIAFGADGGFSYDAFLTRYNADLANDLGNLAHRGLSMTMNWLGNKVPAATFTASDDEMRKIAARSILGFDENLRALQFNKALESAWELVRAGNKYVDTEQPWALNKKGDVARLGTVMRVVLESCLITATLLMPVCPDKACELLGRLGVSEEAARGRVAALLAQARAGKLAFDGLVPGHSTSLGEPLFPRHREMPERIAAMFAEPVQEAPKPVNEVRVEPKVEAKKVEAPATSTEGMVTYDDFAKLKLRTGKIVTAEKHPKADRLLVLTVDVGEEKPRTIVAGIAAKFAPEALVGRNCVVVVNLLPAKLRGIMSEGMLLAAGGENLIDLVSVDAPAGEIVR